MEYDIYSDMQRRRQGVSVIVESVQGVARVLFKIVGNGGNGGNEGSNDKSPRYAISVKERVNGGDVNMS